MPVVVKKNFALTDVKFSSKELMREVGLLVRERIVRRTRSGVSATGEGFVPYSKGYALQKAKALGGSTVNLTLSGAMLNALQVTEVTDTSVTIGY